MIPKRLLLIFAIILFPAFSFVVADFFQLGRQSPGLAPAEQRATRIEVYKATRQLKLLKNDDLLAVYAVSLGSNPIGPKSREGDGRTPEGTYQIDSKNERSRFHLALHISYPSADDRRVARTHGISPGGDIMIHGLPNGLGWLGRFHREKDWTDGCIAVTNDEMNNIWRLVAIGTPIEVKP